MKLVVRVYRPLCNKELLVLVETQEWVSKTQAHFRETAKIAMSKFVKRKEQQGLICINTLE